MSGCARFRELLSADLDGELQAGEEQELLAHLASCSGCQVYRGRLKKTVKAVRQLGPALLGEVHTAAEDVVARLDAVAVDPCEAALGLISAQIDDALSSSEEEALVEHLSACAECQGLRGRLRRSVAQVRGADVVLLEVPSAVFESLRARLEAASAQEQPEPALEVRPEPHAKASSERRPASPPSSSRLLPPRGRVIPFPGGKLLRWGLAAGFLALAGSLAYERFPQVRLAFERHQSSKTPKVRLQDREPVAPVDADEVSPPPREAPAPPPQGERPPPRGDALPPDPVDGPDEHAPIREPKESPVLPEAPDVEAPPVVQESEGRAEPGPNQTRPRIELAALTDLHDRILSPRLASRRRAELIEALGATRFDHPGNYRFLTKILRGRLDAFEGPEALRQAAFKALGSLGTVQAVAALLDAPLRRLHYDVDASGLLSALTSLQRPAPIFALGSALKGQLSEEHRYLIVEALGTLGDPAGYEGLLAVLTARSSSSPLRREAARAMGRLGDPRCVGPLLEGLKDTKRVVRQGSALALGALAAALPDDALACVQALTVALEDKRALVREAAITGLALSRHTAAAFPLVAQLESRSGLRTRARRALIALGGPATRGIRSAEGWRAYWKEKAVGALPPRLAADLDPKLFRVLPSESHGVVFVVDTSGSMKSKWPVVLYELKKALEACTPEASFQVIFFSDGPRSLWQRKRLAPASEANKAKALAAAEAQRVIDVAQTSIGGALRLALEHQGAETIYLISDGLETRGSFGPLERSIRRLNVLRERPARIHTVHVRGGASVELAPYPPQAGEPDDVRFMRSLAWENGGLYAHN